MFSYKIMNRNLFFKHSNKAAPPFYILISIILAVSLFYYCNKKDFCSKVFSSNVSGKAVSSIGIIIEEHPLRRDGSKCLSGLYVKEVLNHAGLFYSLLNKDKFSKVPDNLKILILPYDMTLNNKQMDTISRFVKNGGALIGVGGTSGLDKVFGCRTLGTVFDSYIKIINNHRILSGLESSLHVFRGEDIKAAKGKCFARLTDKDGKVLSDCFVENQFGNGTAILISADLFYSIVHIQQGIKIRKDGIPALDGSARFNDGILKVEDGMVLDWEKDRTSIGTGEGNYIFLHPIADELREIFLKSIFYCAEKQSVAIPMLWYWKKGMPAVAMISHDSDGNDPKLAWSMYKVVNNLKIKTTWCIMYPGGYDKELYEKLKENGYEIAQHYDAKTGDEHTTWSQENFNFQYDWLLKEAGVSNLLTNKNHYTRFEGRLDFFRWCEEKEIQSDQTFGPSKTGSIGFSHSGSHPWFPIDDENDGRFIDILEICMLTQDLVVVCPEYYGKRLVNSVLGHYGVAHFLFHPAHIEKNINGVNVADALRNVVRYAQEKGMEWMTNRDINNWERERRSVKVIDVDLSDETIYKLFTDRNVKDAALLFLIPNGMNSLNISKNGISLEKTRKNIYGFEWMEVVVDLAGKESIKINTE